MSKLAALLGPADEKTPYQRGREAGQKGDPGPAFLNPDSTWEDRLYARGWSRGADDRAGQRS